MKAKSLEDDSNLIAVWAVKWWRKELKLEIQNEIRDLTDEEMDDFLENKYGAVEEDSQIPDSSDGKIIKFKPRDTFH